MTLASPRGRWILNSHQRAACELALTGLVNGRLTHAIIDRTFIADGERWVIDYKTSSPRAGETQSAFLLREAEHYRGQMDSYAALLRAMEPEYRVRAALYFPLIDAWRELC
jgi:ATP-dependent exoDNAse (exonuclease V) beta subunit